MSALHTSVARAIRDASHGAPGGPLPVHNDQRWPDPRRPDCQTCNKAAAAAIGVVLAEAQCAVDALAAPYSANDIDSGHRRSREQYERAVREALAALAALGEHA